MIRSMTGFGAGRSAAGAESVAVEVRSVNGKFCEVKPRLPRELAALEAEVVRAVKARVARGVVDVFVRRDGALARGRPAVDVALAAAWASALRELKAHLGLAGELTLGEIAQLPGVLSTAEATPEAAELQPLVLQALGAALDGLEAMRAREGEALRRDLANRLDALAAGAARIKELAPAQVELYRDRLQLRIAELSRGVAFDPGRLAQEVALLADRVDVAEELTRLASHLSQLRELLASDAPAGRRLEFLVQEVNREVNTVGSKAQHAAIAGLVVDLKAELERVREQIQNVE